MSSNNILTLMDQFFDDSFMPATRRVTTSFFGSVPAINVKEFKDRYEITLTTPGIDIDKANIELHQKILSVNYENTKTEKDENPEQGNLLRQEYTEHFAFSRSIALPKNVDEESVQATYKKGIMTITVKKLPEEQPKKVNIKEEN